MFDPEKPPELDVIGWVNSKEPLTLAGLKDKVVVLVPILGTATAPYPATLR